MRRAKEGVGRSPVVFFAVCLAAVAVILAVRSGANSPITAQRTERGADVAGAVSAAQGPFSRSGVRDGRAIRSLGELNVDIPQDPNLLPAGDYRREIIGSTVPELRARLASLKTP